MGRKSVLLGFALLGFVLGFMAWLVRNSVGNALASIGLNPDLAGAILAGVAGGFVMLIVVLVWSTVTN
jgi:hypothetical protein